MSSTFSFPSYLGRVRILSSHLPDAFQGNTPLHVLQPKFCVHFSCIQCVGKKENPDFVNLTVIYPDFFISSVGFMILR